MSFTTSAGASDAVTRLVKRIGARACRSRSTPTRCATPAATLANAGHDTRAIQDWLGHRSIQHTVRYTELAPNRFRDFWRD